MVFVVLDEQREQLGERFFFRGQVGALIHLLEVLEYTSARAIFNLRNVNESNQVALLSGGIDGSCFDGADSTVKESIPSFAQKVFHEAGANLPFIFAGSLCGARPTK